VSTAEQIADELAELAPLLRTAQLDSGTLIAQFCSRVHANHGTLDCVSSRSEAARCIGEYLYRRFRSHRVVAGADPRLSAMPWRDGGVLVRTGAAREIEPAAVSYAVGGIAESGSVALVTGRGNPASNNFLTEDHIVLLDTADLHADYEAMWQSLRLRFEADDWPRGVHFISGPSATADIGGELVVGAHGPLHWHVVLIQSER
jgi:L-lactate dehydrogenase complex protein LldG